MIGGGGGGGSSYVSGAVTTVSYSAGTTGSGTVTISAYQYPYVQTFLGTDSANWSRPKQFVVPPGIGTLVVKAWGGGGGGYGSNSGGAGAYVTASWTVSPGQSFSIINSSPWSGSNGIYPEWGGIACCIKAPNGGVFWAAGGGGAGAGPNGNGGVGGAPNGQPGGSGYGNSGGGGGSISGSGASVVGVGGAGGYGDATQEQYDDSGNDLGYANTVGNGANGATGSTYAFGSWGWCGSNGDGFPYYGGIGGNGFGGGGGGGAGDTGAGGGGGGGGASVVINANGPIPASMLAGVGRVPANTSDSDYPGGNVGYGGTANGYGGPAAVVIISYPYLPTISSPLIQTHQPGQLVDYFIAATYAPISYGATNLPPGLSVNSVTGEITGTPTTAGTYNSTISATNVTGTTTTTLTWNIDATPPSVPTGVMAANIMSTAFTLSWAASTDNVSVAGYEVMRGSTIVGSTPNLSTSVAGLAPGSTYTMSVRTQDAAGNWSNWSAPITVTTGTDTIPPSIPGALTTSGLSATFLTLNWSPSADNEVVTDYEVSVNGSSVGLTGGATYKLTTGLTANTSYAFAARARDAAGNWSGWSPPLTVTTAAPTADTLLGIQTFPYVGRFPQTYTVPAGASYVVVKAWGAGGGGYQSYTGAPTYIGGVGGYATATYNATPGDQFVIRVAESGMGNQGYTHDRTRGQGGWPGGGDAQSGNQTNVSYGGSGGGFTSVALPYGEIWAGGGGGAGSNGNGGAGGGGSGTGGNAGGGGTTSGPGTSPTQTIPGGFELGGFGGYEGAGGGGGYYGGGASGYYYGSSLNCGTGGAGGGSSLASGTAYNIVYQQGGSLPGGAQDPLYPGNAVGAAGTPQTAGNGAVVILAYQTPGANPTQTYLPTGSNQAYIAPPGADYVIVKAWGAGAASNGSTAGAGGGFVSATYNLSAGQTITVNAGGGGTASGATGASSIVSLPDGTVLTAAGGGSGGTSSVAPGTQGVVVSQVLNASGMTPPSTTDVNYPGNNAGYGGANGAGGDGAIVIIAHIQPPSITSPLTQNITQNASVTYTITASNGVTGYSVTGLPQGLTFNPVTATITGSVPTVGSYTSVINATNRAGTTQANLVWNVSADTSPPTVPGAVQASNLTPNSLALTWSPSADNAGVTGYEIQQNGVSLGTVAVPGFTVTGLVANTANSFAVRARDAAGNWSALSTAISVTTPQIGQLPAGVPLLNYSDRSATTATLLWSPDPNATAAAGYNIYRDGVLIATTTQLSYVDTGLGANTTHVYNVQAFDAGGNLSASSLSVSVTTTQDFSADADHDGIPDASESVLFPSGHTTISNDSGNLLHVNIQQPSR